jgi:hypothetical protein
MQSIIFKQSLKINRLLLITKLLTKNKNLHLQVRPIKAELIKFSNKQKILPILFTQLTTKYNQLILIFNKLHSILAEKFKSFDLFSSSSTTNNTNSNKSQEQNETPQQPPNPKKLIVNLLISIATFYLILSVLRDFERMKGQSKNPNESMQGVVMNGVSGENNSNNPSEIKVNISQKSGNTYGNIAIQTIHL